MKEFDAGNIRSVIVSDPGYMRINNEDVGLFLTSDDEEISREKGCLLMVADGMGGHNAGGVASKIAGKIISQEYFNQSGSIENSLLKAFEAANENILEMSRSNRDMQGMGTTCTAVVIFGQDIYYAHVGDSRAYILKDGRLKGITEDHTYVQELANKGLITVEQAKVHPRRNMLTNAVGTKESLRIDSGRFAIPFEEGDRLMLCSDGLYDNLTDHEIAGILAGKSLENAANEMVKEAKKRGGHDNITIVLAERKSS